VVLVIRQSGF